MRCFYYVWKYANCCYKESNPTYSDGTSVFDLVGQNSSNEDAEVFKFGLGDTKEIVQKSMGSPSSIINSGDTWFYDTSSVNFKDGIVEGWNDITNNLRLK